MTLAAYANGGITDYSPAQGQLKVLFGASDVTAAATLSATAAGCTGTINTAENTPVAGQPKGFYQVTAMSADTATLTITATYAGVTLTEIFSISTAKGGYEIVGALPTTNLFEGRIVFLTTDDKLYRYTGTAWTAAVPAVDISGALADAQIASLAASKITGQLSNAQIASIAAAKLTGQITSTQITDGSISTPKLAAGSVTSAQIAADTITAGNIAANAVTSSEIAAGAVVAGKIATGAVQAGTIAAGAVTAGTIAANAVTATEIASGSVIADKIAAGAVTAAKMNVTELSAITATIGLLRTASTGARTEISNNLIEVYDAAGVRRVRLGVW